MCVVHAGVHAEVEAELKRNDWDHITAANVVYISGDLKDARRYSLQCTSQVLLRRTSQVLGLHTICSVLSQKLGLST
jgi:hypothetical protein